VDVCDVLLCDVPKNKEEREDAKEQGIKGKRERRSSRNSVKMNMRYKRKQGRGPLQKKKKKKKIEIEIRDAGVCCNWIDRYGRGTKLKWKKKRGKTPWVCWFEEIGEKGEKERWIDIEVVLG
jgi:hypothetical protein